MTALPASAPLSPTLNVNTREGLLCALERVDAEGWDGPSGTAVLRYAKDAVVAPAVRRAGVSERSAEFVESTGWAAAWEELCGRAVREVVSPWGIVAAAVRSAVLGEQLAEHYGTGVYAAWQIKRFRDRQEAGRQAPRTDWTRVADRAALSRPVSLTALVDLGWEPVSAPFVPSAPCPRVDVLAGVLARHGWPQAVAKAAILHVADHARTNPDGPPRAHGWREMATELGIPPWQARRVTVLLLGAPGWPGLIERLETGGVAALCGPVIEAAIRATSDESMHPPVRAAETMARTAAPLTLAS